MSSPRLLQGIFAFEGRGFDSPSLLVEAIGARDRDELRSRRALVAGHARHAHEPADVARERHDVHEIGG